MSTVIAIHWTQPALQVAVVQHGHLEATVAITAEVGLERAIVGQRLAAALAPHSSARAKVIVAVGRSSLEWQHLSLPPCPADELPDLVQLQADREPGADDEDVGFDFLPLVGDEHTAHEVLSVAIAPNELSRIRQACQTANLKLDRIVPLSIGWPEITNLQSYNKQGWQIYVAPQTTEALLWATQAEQVVLFRQLQLANTHDATALTTSISSEVRRTLLALSQHPGNDKPNVTLVGHQQNQLTELANTLNQQLEVTVQPLDVTSGRKELNEAANSNTSLLPLSGLAIAESHGTTPLIDLLHPRRRPRKEVNIRTYSLAATAAVLSLLLFGWLGYSKLQAPLNQADRDRAELALLKEPLDKLNEYERRAAAIREWNAESPNLLAHLQQVSKALRPEALESKIFAVDTDVVLEKLDLDKRQITIDALTRGNNTVQPVGQRFRDAGYSYRRDKSEPSKTNKDYPWYFKSTIEVTSASEPNHQPLSSATAKEPQS